MLDKQFDVLKADIQELKAAYNMLLDATKSFCGATDKMLGEVNKRLEKLEQTEGIDE